VERSQLYRAHKSLGATFAEFDGWELPKTYAATRKGVEEEYVAARERVAVIDRSHVSKMTVTGKDCLDLLHRLTTQYFFYKNKDVRKPFSNPSEDPDSLKPGMGVSAALITPKARLIDLLIVYGLDDALLVLFSPRNRQRVPQWIDQFVFREDFQMTDVTTKQGMLTLTGARASAALDPLAGQALSALPMHHFVSTEVNGSTVIIARTWHLAGDSYNLITASENVVNLWNAVMELGQAQGIAPVGEDIYDILRVEAGIPVVGKELSEEVNPWEARLDSSIHTAKGCYTGQEVIARIQTYQKVHKRLLTGIRLADSILPELNSKMTADGREVGFVTSAVRSPTLGAIALAYVHGQFDDPGVKVTVHTASGDVEGEVAPLPFNET
jgi:folate-binding protein YgfZ